MQETTFIFDIDEAAFESAVIQRSHEIPVVVDFWAPWCGPCRMISPVLERLTQQAQGAFILVKVNVDDNPGISARYGIQGIPAVKGFRGGKVAAEFVGAQPEPAIRQFLKKLVPNEADRLLEQADGALAQHAWAEAERLYRAALAQGVQPATAAAGLLKATLAQGKVPDVRQLLDNPPGGQEIVAVERYRPLIRLLEAGTGSETGQNGPAETFYLAAGQALAQGNLTGAMDELLATLRRDKRYRQGDAHKAMLALFDLLGEHHPLTRDYRQKLSMVLF